MIPLPSYFPSESRPYLLANKELLICRQPRRPPPCPSPGQPGCPCALRLWRYERKGSPALTCQATQNDITGATARQIWSQLRCPARPRRRTLASFNAVRPASDGLSVVRVLGCKLCSARMVLIYLVQSLGSTEQRWSWFCSSIRNWLGLAFGIGLTSS